MVTLHRRTCHDGVITVIVYVCSFNPVTDLSRGKGIRGGVAHLAEILPHILGMKSVRSLTH